MKRLEDFPVTRKWPARHPGRIQLYSLPTPNGVKVSIALEELGLAYEPHFVSFEKNEQMSPEFLSLNPNNKIPAILDPDGPGGKPLALFESGAILVYLADKAQELLPPGAARYETLQWLMCSAGSRSRSAIEIPEGRASFAATSVSGEACRRHHPTDSAAERTGNRAAAP
jgi:GST-like protein